RTGVRFLPHPFPTASSAPFAVRLPSRGSNGVTSFTFSIAPGSGRAFRPVVRPPRQGTLQPLDLTTYRFGPSLTASCAGLFLRPLPALPLGCPVPDGWPPTAVMLAVAVLARALTADQEIEVTLSPRLRTSPLPETPAGAADRWRNIG